MQKQKLPKRKLLIIVITLLLTIMFNSCIIDDYFITKIVNNSENAIEIEIQCKKETYEESLYCLKNVYGGTINQLDTINLITKITLYPKQELEIDLNRSGTPNLKFFKRISIFGKDTIILNNQFEMKKKFEKKWRNKFVLEVE